MNTENGWLVNLARNQNSLVVVARQRFCKRADHAQLINTSGFYQNAGELYKSLNAMSPDPFLRVAFRKGSGLVLYYTLTQWGEWRGSLCQTYTVEPPRKGHFGTNINSSGLSPL